VDGRVVECDKDEEDDCLHKGSNYHFRINGDDSRVPGNRSFSLNQRPAIEDNVNYRFTFHLKSARGRFEALYPVQTTNPSAKSGKYIPNIKGFATGEWEKYEFTAKGRLGSRLHLQFRADGLNDWKVDDVTAVKII
jgi:hypothetical protein